MNNSEKVKQLLLKDLGVDLTGKNSVKKYNPATYTVTLSTDYKTTLSLILSSLEFVSFINGQNIDQSFSYENFSEDPYQYLELIKKPEPERTKELTGRYYAMTKKLRDYMENAKPEKEAKIPITGEEYFIAKSVMLTNLLTMASLSEDKELLAKNQQIAKAAADYATLVEAFMQDKDVEIESNDMLVLSYSLYYSITKQWQNQADAKQNFQYLKPEEAVEMFSPEDIQKFMQNINPLSNP